MSFELFSPENIAKAGIDWKGCSELYQACRNNRVDYVKCMLTKITNEELNRIEPNGSTALHVACYYGHKEIVELLLKAGAERSIMNIYKCLPYDEASLLEIKYLFLRSGSDPHITSLTGAIDWVLIDDVNLADKANEDRKEIEGKFKRHEENNTLGKMFQMIEENYVEKALKNTEGAKNVQRVLKKAACEQNPEYLIKAYTMESYFYIVINLHLAVSCMNLKHERDYFVALLCHHPKLNKYVYKGLAYRGLTMTDEDLMKYKTGFKLMVKSFQSSSISRPVAEAFLYKNTAQPPKATDNHLGSRLLANGRLAKNLVLCTYNIRHLRSGLHIEDISEYVNEGEVLIMPHTVFAVKKSFKTMPNNSPRKEPLWVIELDEIDEYE